MKYLLLFCADESGWMSMPDDERNEAIQSIGEWYRRLYAAGAIVEGRRLFGRDSAVTVRLGPPGRSEEPLVVDGPFLEAKEAIGSYAVIEVGDRNEAIAVASSWPGGGVVEIRPIMDE